MSELPVEIQAGVGDPSSPLYGQLLSEEDEKRLDEKGEEVVDGLPWSECKTGVYLSVLVSPNLPYADRRTLGGGVCAVPSKIKGDLKGPLNIALFTTLGKPAFNCPFFGASLELPSDLAKDGLKKKYVIEWLVHTVSESLGGFAIELNDPLNAETVGLWVSQAAEDAIRATGL